MSTYGILLIIQYASIVLTLFMSVYVTTKWKKNAARLAFLLLCGDSRKQRRLPGDYAGADGKRSDSGVADCYDAMTSTRTYSTPKEQSAVRAEIERCKGSQFDPRIADVMISMIDDDRDYTMHE